MNNFEAIVKNNPQYVKEVLAHHVFDSELKNAINDNRKSYAWYNDEQKADKDGINFLNKEYIQPALNNVEKIYLYNIIRPFRNKVEYIKKSCWNGKYFIRIALPDGENVDLPYFTNNDMYKGMELDRKYTLKELGI